MSKKTQTGSVLARILGTTLFGALSTALSTEQFNEAETKVAAELKEKGEGDSAAGEDPLTKVTAATEALGKGKPGATTEGPVITAEAFKAEQERATKAECQLADATKERDTYKAYFDKHNAQGKVLPGADATTTDEKAGAVELSAASAQALEFFQSRNR